MSNTKKQKGTSIDLARYAGTYGEYKPDPIPSYCCQRCGACIGWLMVWGEKVFGVIHDCNGRLDE